MPGDVRRRWHAADGVVDVRRPSHKCNGMTYDGAGNLYVCEHATSALVMETPGGDRRVLATHWRGRALNSPNDVIVRSDGVVFFTDPTYGRMPVFGVERPTEMGFQGLYRFAVDESRPPGGDHQISNLHPRHHRHSIAKCLSENHASQPPALFSGLIFNHEQRVLIGFILGSDDRVQRNHSDRLARGYRRQGQRCDHPNFQKALRILDRNLDLKQAGLLIR